MRISDGGSDVCSSDLFPAVGIAKASPPLPCPPGHMGDIMVRAGDTLGIGPREAERSMQRVYEGGLLSYPRAGSRGVSRTVARKLAKLFKDAGQRFDDEIGRAHVCNPVTNAHLVCRILLEKQNN